VEIGVIDLPGSAREVVVRGTTAWVTNDRRGVCSIDLRDPEQPAVTGCIDLKPRGAVASDEVEIDGPGFWIDALVFSPPRIER